MASTHHIETVINGHHVNKNHYFSLKSYQWRVRHHKTMGEKESCDWSISLGRSDWPG